MPRRCSFFGFYFSMTGCTAFTLIIGIGISLCSPGRPGRPFLAPILDASGADRPLLAFCGYRLDLLFPLLYLLVVH